MSEYFACMYVWVGAPSMPDVCGGQQRASVPLGLQLQMAVCLGAGN